MALGKRIRNRRLELGMTQAELAKKTGVSEATINRYESGDIKNPRQPILLKLIQALKVEPNYLMGWSDAPPTPTVDPQRRYLLDKVNSATPEQLDKIAQIMRLIEIEDISNQ